MTTPTNGNGDRLLRVAVPNKGALSTSAQEILRESLPGASGVPAGEDRLRLG